MKNLFSSINTVVATGWNKISENLEKIKNKFSNKKKSDEIQENPENDPRKSPSFFKKFTSNIKKIKDSAKKITDTFSQFRKKITDHIDKEKVKTTISNVKTKIATTCSNVKEILKEIFHIKNTHPVSPPKPEPGSPASPWLLIKIKNAWNQVKTGWNKIKTGWNRIKILIIDQLNDPPKKDNTIVILMTGIIVIVLVIVMTIR